MSALTTSLIVCVLLIGGALLGILLRRLLPDHQLDGHAKDVVRLGCGLMATISGLVLGLLVSSAKTTYDAQRDEVRQLTANVIMLDEVLERLGPKAQPARLALRAAVVGVIDRIWSDGSTAERPRVFTTIPAGETAFLAIRSITPGTDDERFYQSEALQAVISILQARLLLFQQADSAVPPMLLGILVFWLIVLFASFSLFSPLNPTALTAVVVFALSASSAIFLILEMYQPFAGLMQLDSTPLRQVLAPIG